MTVMTVWALILLIRQYGFSMIGIIALLLLVLALLLIWEAIRVLKPRRPAVGA
jgi:hypothetical protein